MNGHRITGMNRAMIIIQDYNSFLNKDIVKKPDNCYPKFDRRKYKKAIAGLFIFEEYSDKNQARVL